MEGEESDGEMERDRERERKSMLLIQRGPV